MCTANLPALQVGVPAILSFGDRRQFAGTIINTVLLGLGEMEHTSQRSRMAERPPATDLRGGKPSEDSFTNFRANLVVAYAVDFQSDLLSGTALGPMVRSKSLWGL